MRTKQRKKKSSKELNYRFESSFVFALESPFAFLSIRIGILELYSPCNL